MKRLALIFSVFAIFFVLGGLVVSSTIKQNTDEITIIQNNDQSSVLGSQFLDKSLLVVSQPVVKIDDSASDLDKISVNDATLEELDSVPGIGPVTAQKIIDARPWEDFEEALRLISTRWRDAAREKLKLN